MWINIAGSILIIISSSLMGFWMCERERLRIVELTELQRVMQFIRNEILVFSTLFTDIMRKISVMEDLRVHILFRNILKELEKSPSSSIEESWKKSLLSRNDGLYLQREDIELLLSFAISLERADVGGHIKNIDIMVERLKELEQRVNEKYSMNAKLIRSAGVLTGMVICIILF